MCAFATVGGFSKETGNWTINSTFSRSGKRGHISLPLHPVERYISATLSAVFSPSRGTPFFYFRPSIDLCIRIVDGDKFRCVTVLLIGVSLRFMLESFDKRQTDAVTSTFPQIQQFRLTRVFFCQFARDKTNKEMLV